jgi:hypothetical protein
MIFKSGVFPKAWMQGIIVPVFKKGDQSNVEHFCGITLNRSLAKLFNIVINDRLSWSEKHNFGFKKRDLTTDAIYTLLSLIVFP